MTEICANTHYLKLEEQRIEAQEIFHERVDQVLDEWWEDKDSLIGKWDDLINGMLNPAAQFIEAITADKAELLLARIRLLFREIYRDKAIRSEERRGGK